MLISNAIQDTWVVSKTCWMIKPLNMLLLSDHTVVTNKYVGKQCLIIAGKNSNWRENWDISDIIGLWSHEMKFLE